MTVKVIGLHEVRQNNTILRFNLTQSFPQHSTRRPRGLVHFGPSEPPVGTRKSEHLASTEVFDERRQQTALLLAAARVRLPSRLEFQGSAESSKIERRRWRRRHCLLRHLAAAAAPNAGGGGAGPSARAKLGGACIELRVLSHTNWKRLQFARCWF